MDKVKELNEFIIANIMGCHFVGISGDNEIFIRFDHDDEDLELGAAKRLKNEFAYVSNVTVVVTPSVDQLKKMVDDLNVALDETKPVSNLLDIGSF